MLFLLVVQLFATLFMVGLIWFVQIVHYPLFAKVGRTEFPKYEQAHQRLTSWVVGPMMLIEIGTAAVLPLSLTSHTTTWLAWLCLALLIVIWLSTWFLQVPAHHSLQVDGFCDATHRKLVQTNWIRTVAWSLRGILVVAIALLCVQSPP